MASSALLPEYAAPPVEEVAVSIMFEGLERLSSAHVGRLWQKYPEFPRTEDHPEIDLAVELPPDPSSHEFPRVEFGKPRLRTWFLSKDGTRLIQVQRNRFAYNWRRAESGNTYPHYHVLREQFVEALAVFRDFLRTSDFPDIKPVQSELTYVNHIKDEGGWPHSRVADVVNVWRESATGFLPAPEDVRFAVRYVMPDSKGAFAGRLAVTLAPAYLVNNHEEILALTMVARGRPLDSSVDGAFAFLDLGHEWIVRGFTELTTAAMHERWGRNR
ncbi:MAG: TIGR04255 family protein [Vicinamibacterales bacterium]